MFPCKPRPAISRDRQGSWLFLIQSIAPRLRARTRCLLCKRGAHPRKLIPAGRRRACAAAHSCARHSLRASREAPNVRLADSSHPALRGPRRAAPPRHNTRTQGTQSSRKMSLLNVPLTVMFIPASSNPSPRLDSNGCAVSKLHPNSHFAFSWSWLVAPCAHVMVASAVSGISVKPGVKAHGSTPLPFSFRPPQLIKVLRQFPYFPHLTL